MFLQICIISKPGLPLLTSALTQNKRKMKTIKIHFIRCLINRKISLGIIKKLNNCQTTLYWYSQNDLFVHQIFICVSWFLSHEEFWGGMDKWRKCFLLILGEDFSIFLIYQWKKKNCFCVLFGVVDSQVFCCSSYQYRSWMYYERIQGRRNFSEGMIL